MELNKKQIKFISHSLGINYEYAQKSRDKEDSILPTKFYRDYYCYFSGKTGGKIDTDILEIEIVGYIVRSVQRGCLYFFITDLGKSKFREIFEKEVTNKFIPLSKGEQTYRDYEYSEYGYCFSDYLGIKMPRLESKQDTFRYVSTKYRDINGDWCEFKKEAKKSYKEKLNNHIKNKK